MVTAAGKRRLVLNHGQHAGGWAKKDNATGRQQQGMLSASIFPMRPLTNWLGASASNKMLTTDWQWMQVKILKKKSHLALFLCQSSPSPISRREGKAGVACFVFQAWPALVGDQSGNREGHQGKAKWALASPTSCTNSCFPLAVKNKLVELLTGTEWRQGCKTPAFLRGPGDYTKQGQFCCVTHYLISCFSPILFEGSKHLLFL